MHGRHPRELAAFQARLDVQASRTASLRHKVWSEAQLPRADHILDVGSGSGAVTQDLQAFTDAKIVALDAEAAMVRRTAQRVGLGSCLQADARRLPFADGAFDAVVCNLVLMWSPQPAQVVAEMARVVRPGGIVVATMEPDYGGKVHYPENPLIDLVWKGSSIRARGGDPHAGRQLRSHFTLAGLQTDVGISNLEVLTPEQDIAAWGRNRAYYRRTLASSGFSTQEIDAWEAEYTEALDAGVQMSWFPFFYAIGRKAIPGDVDAP